MWEHVTIKPYMILKSIFPLAPLLFSIAKVCINFNRKPLLTNNEKFCTKSQITPYLDLDERINKYLVKCQSACGLAFCLADACGSMVRDQVKLFIVINNFENYLFLHICYGDIQNLTEY
jgi:hypothetical protein